MLPIATTQQASSQSVSERKETNCSGTLPANPALTTQGRAKQELGGLVCLEVFKHRRVCSHANKPQLAAGSTSSCFTHCELRVDQDTQHTGHFRVEERSKEVGSLRRYQINIEPSGLTSHLTPGLEAGGRRVQCSCQRLIYRLTLSTEK